MDAESTEEVKRIPDKYAIWPSITATILFISSFWVYFNYISLIIFVGILYVFIIGIVGLFKLWGRQFRNGASYMVPAILFFSLLSPPLANFRIKIINLTDHIRFSFEKEKYEAEVKEMENSGIKYKEWKWGNFNGTNDYSLVYDESDRIASVGSNPFISPPCSRNVRRLETHFYVVEDFCP
jgi:energy-coupling factor transporter transmembrane protein EcfT